ncbi:hypothetical protein [Cerasicoccus frondis]|uniref:hypothetical protein n=1 Tax=Cerasicoccus frondis TaxID=490090 RepID=UPI00285280F6|nr:hypothetical protein [Cerasicoccus frondis]
MKMMMTVSLPHHMFNVAAKDGSVMSKFNAAIEAVKPEATYFMSLDGKRSIILIVDLPDASKIPWLCEPWFLAFEADVSIQPVATPEDFAHADFATIAKQWVVA